MDYIPPAQRLCDCRCPLHHRLVRTVFNERGCACTITGATQPMTLLIEQWRCALFLTTEGMHFVNAIEGGQWDWAESGRLDPSYDGFPMGQLLEHLMHASQIAISNTDR
ncbi:hypothetical protein [Catellatospora tritici]|uniref:hypothetical protein n=1 Tax=Catellatospora tritici TaxID=2851566 RepID=UPI001C2D3DC0|nr:hypothetical protein [Catellatospora tritici]MBV1854590.1 hypothetical protein [Catellatospora tritici]